MFWAKFKYFDTDPESEFAGELLESWAAKTQQSPEKIVEKRNVDFCQQSCSVC